MMRRINSPDAYTQGERTRAAILREIAAGRGTQASIAGFVGVTQCVVSRHIHRLISEGAVECVTPRRGNRAPVYRLPEPSDA